MSITMNHPDSLTSETRSWPRGIAATGVKAGVLGACATEVYGFVARAAGVTMRAGNIGASETEAITVGMFAMGTLICTFWGTVIAKLADRHAIRPASTFRVVAVTLAVASLVGPVFAGHTGGTTKAMLAVAHMVAAAVIIPILTRRLATTTAHEVRR
jgi:Family of unknown function (DUF6069)